MNAIALSSRPGGSGRPKSGTCKLGLWVRWKGSNCRTWARWLLFSSRPANFPRRFLDPQDHNFVFSAVEGQTVRELETNLPAMVNYIRLSMSANAFLPAARLRKPLLGQRRGMETLLEIARSVYDFRSRQLNRVRSGEIRTGQVLTKANLGALGDRATLARLEQAYKEGHEQFTLQRNLVVLGVLAVQLQFGLVVSLWIRRKADGLVVVRGRA